MPSQAAQSARSAPSLARAPKKGDHVFLVDGSSYIFRAYHALPPLSRKSDGLQVNAVLGFCNMLWKLMRDMKPEDKPTHLAVIFDKSEKTFRNELYKDYKAHRPDAPADLIPQFPLIRDATRAFDIPCLEMLGFEADDLRSEEHTSELQSPMYLVCRLLLEKKKKKKIKHDINNHIQRSTTH